MTSETTYTSKEFAFLIKITSVSHLEIFRVALCMLLLTYVLMTKCTHILADYEDSTMFSEISSTCSGMFCGTSGSSVSAPSDKENDSAESDKEKETPISPRKRQRDDSSSDEDDLAGVSPGCVGSKRGRGRGGTRARRQGRGRGVPQARGRGRG